MGGGVEKTKYNNHGFTLAELLGVIIIIGVLALLILPTIEKSIKNGKDKLYQTQIKNIEMAANDWALDHLFELPDNEGETVTVLLGQLKVDGYIDLDVSDPRDGVKFPNDMEIVITRKYNNYVYGVVEGSGTPGNTELPEVTEDIPVITLNSSKIVTVEVGGIYTELGAKAKYKDQDITDLVVITGEVDTNVEGNYTIHYNVSYEEKSAKEITRVVRVVKEGEVPPTPVEGELVITLSPNGTNGYSKATIVNINVTGGSNLSELVYRINNGEEISVNHNQITLNEDGEYTLEVTARDSEGRVKTINSKIYQIDVTPPTIMFAEDMKNSITVSEVDFFDLKEGVSVSDNNLISMSNVEVHGNLSKTPGNYTIIYQAVDVAGNIATKTRTITVTKDGGQTSELGILFSPNSTSSYQKATTVTVTTYGSEEITSLTYKLDGGEEKEVIDNQIVLDQDGEHHIEVTAIDASGNTKTVMSGTYLIDVTPPELHFSEEDTSVTLISSQVPGYNLKNGVSVTDNNLISIHNVKVTGSLSITPGLYTIIYEATDIAGNITTKTRTIIVEKSNNTDNSYTEPVLENSPDTRRDDPDGNLRFVGASPRNYVNFNNELWRIIGVFDGQIKIIREEPYNTAIAWHSSASHIEWNATSLYTELSKIQNSMPQNSLSYIDTNHVWNLGGALNELGAWTRANMYHYERGNMVYINPNNNNRAKSTWIGAIGLMYPSDYGYATSSTLPECNNASMNSWTSIEGNTCATNSWLYNNKYSQWTITSTNISLQNIFYISSDGRVSQQLNTTTIAASPVVFLKSKVRIASGQGTKENPYELSIAANIMGKEIVSADIEQIDNDGNPRYVGPNPNNYIKFNNELWRIIGIFNGQAKIIREETYGSLPFDKGESDGGTHGTNGYSDWNQATLKDELNTDFLNQINTTSQSYIDTGHTWNIGMMDYYYNSRISLYSGERGTKKSSVMQSLIWTGAVGLMYPSDYAYAAGSKIPDCDTTYLSLWNNVTTKKSCAQRSWLYDNNGYWTMSPGTSSASNDDVSHPIHLSSSGNIELWSANSHSGVKPVVYLKANVKINGGTGTKEDPYTIYMDASNIAEQIKSSPDIAHTDPGGNNRYVGADPKNYVLFNNELWRIIGEFGGQVKIVRTIPYSTSISFSTNDWVNSTLKTSLNTDFLGSIDYNSRNYIDKNYRWKLYTTNTYVRPTLYNNERGDGGYYAKSTWVGAIGLISPSDYGYSTSSTNNICNTANMSNWNNGTAQTECANNTWLKPNTGSSWTITPYSTSGYVSAINYSGRVIQIDIANKNAAYPALYLKPNVKIISGTGQQNDPYILEI